MIDLVLKLIAQLVALIGVREERGKEYFDRYVAPTYDLLTGVFGDYMTLFAELEQMAAEATEPKAVIEHLERGRMKYLAARIQLRTALYYNWKDIQDLPKFERGVLGVLHGGLAPFEDRPNKGENPYLHGGHTLLDLLYRLAQRDSMWKEWFMRSLDEQRHAVQTAYTHATEGYEELKSSFVPEVAPGLDPVS